MQVILVKQLNKKHLFWIIPAVLIIGLAGGSFFVMVGLDKVMTDYPLVTCIMMAEDALKPDQTMPFIANETREFIQRRCAELFIDFNETYDEMVGIGNYSAGGK